MYISELKKIAVGKLLASWHRTKVLMTTIKTHFILLEQEIDLLQYIIF